MRYRKKGMFAGILGTIVGMTAMLAGTVMATNPGGTGISLEVLGRATLEAFRLKQHNFRVIAREANDVVIGELVINANGDTGWHTHPGPTFATVAEGEVDLTIVDERGRCTTERFGPGQGFAEGGGIVHIARAVGGAPAVLYVTFMAIPPDVELPNAVIDWSPPAPTGRHC
ncbi:MAG: cupin domain-containing protein [Candidatus Tectimicrobiota bacterium]